MTDGKKRGSRRQQKRPDPLAPNVAERSKIKGRMSKRVPNPGVRLEAREGHGDDWRLVSPHNDLDLWELQILDAFGTRSFAVMRTFLDNLRSLCKLSRYDNRSGRWKPDEAQLNAALAMVAENRPATSIEAALLAQMVAVHWMTMRVSADALGSGGMVHEQQAALAGKLARTFTMQLDALRALKGKKTSTRQSITVKRVTEYSQHNHHHQHLHDHRATTGCGGVPESETQPHDTRAETIEGRCTLPSPQQSGEVVSLPRRKG